MKLIKLTLSIACFSLMFFSCKKEVTENNITNNEEQSNTENSVNNKAVLPENLQTASMQIEGMSCQVMCASKIQKELEATNGIQEANVDFEQKSATVKYDSSVISPEKISQIIESVAGGDTYKVSNLTSTADHASFVFQEKDKKLSRKERRKAKKEAQSQESSINTTETKSIKPGCCSGKKTCSKNS